jgi:hypothetical protein
MDVTDEGDGLDRVVVLTMALAQALLENMLCAGMAFPAIVCDAEIFSKFRHRSCAIANRLMDSTFGYVIADTNNHDCPVIVMLTGCLT